MSSIQTKNQYSFKGKSTIYTAEKRETLLYNAVHDAAIREKAKNVIEKADDYLAYVDTIYDMVVSQKVYRNSYISAHYDVDKTRCRYCGTDIARIPGGGIYAWKTDPLHDPWKIECPACHRKFPSNDFGSYYKLGLDQEGVFHPEKAKEEHIKLFGGLENVGYLKNELYPEMDEHTDAHGNIVNAGVHGWGVDAGEGYHTTNAAGEHVWHAYIAFYIYQGLWGGSTGVIRKALNMFRDAYLYTNDIKYARAGAKLLDRIADFYPDYELYPWHKLRGCASDYRGKILDSVWECGLCKEFAMAYDAFYPVYEDKELIDWLHAKAVAHGTTDRNPRDSADALRGYIEERILRIIYRDAVDNMIAGNFGMDQSSVVCAAVVLNTLPETKEWIDWVMAHGDIQNYGPNPPKRTGGRVLTQLVDVVDRDGQGSENPGYNCGWVEGMQTLADLLQGYELYPEVDFYKNPRYLKMLDAHIGLTLGDYYTAQIGDGGALGSAGIRLVPSAWVAAYIATGNPYYLQMLYMCNDHSSKGLCYPDTVKNPSRLADDVEQAIKTYGELDLGSTLMAAYGFMALRDGSYKAEGGSTSRDFWVYTGAAPQHAHQDSMNLGLSAYGLNMAPDLGYPKNTGTEANSIQWVSATISHNTVVVDEETQRRDRKRIGGPQILHFDDAGSVKLMDAARPFVYEQVDDYRRSVVMVKVDDTVSYGVDFFHIKGGHDHLYSFHSQSHEIGETEGLHLVAQEGGTYASPDVPYGPDPSPLSGHSWDQNVYNYPAGYTWLDHVEKDLAPDAQFAVDFNVSDYRNVLPDASGLHLRLTMLGDEALDEVSIVNGYPVDNAGNPNTHIKYLLARRKGEEGLETLFTTVLEPYKGERYLSDTASVPVVRADGKSIADGEIVKAVKVCHVGGRVDYIAYALDNTVEYIVDDRFRFRGFVGVVTYENDAITYTYLHDGDILTDAITGAVGAYTGTVAGFTDTLSMENSIEITPEQADISLAELTDKCILVANDGKQNGVYRIKGAKRLENGNILLDIGDITLIRSFVDKNNMSLGYIYNIAKGQSFRIPTTAVKA